MAIVSPPAASGKPRSLTFRDITWATHLPPSALRRFAAPIVDALQSLPVHNCCCDAVGIAYRGAVIYRDILDGRTIHELAAAYVYLRGHGCYYVLADALETAVAGE